MTKELLFVILESGNGDKKFLLGADQEEIITAIRAKAKNQKERDSLLAEFNKAKKIWQPIDGAVKCDRPLW